jgi:hypothetical protein
MKDGLAAWSIANRQCTKNKTYYYKGRTIAVKSIVNNVNVAQRNCEASSFLVHALRRQFSLHRFLSTLTLEASVYGSTTAIDWQF